MNEHEIRQVLSEIYDTPERARIVAGDIGLPLSRISFSYPMDVCWSNIWREAELQHKELKLIERVKKEYSVDRIIEIYDWLQPLVSVQPNQPSEPQTVGNRPTQQLEQSISSQKVQQLSRVPEVSGSTNKSPGVDKESTSSPQDTSVPRIIKLPSIKPLISKFLLIIKFLISNILYFTVGSLLFLNFLVLFNILDPMTFLKKLMRVNPGSLLIAGGVFGIISGAIAYDLISIRRRKRCSLSSPPSQDERTTGDGASWYRKILVYRAIIVICLIAICIPLSFWRYNTIETGVGLLSDNPHIGVCDGTCAFDEDRLTGDLKQEAANYFQQKQDTFACQYLRWAATGDIPGPETTNPELNDARSQGEDTTDAEAKIDYENRCTSMQCPCISFVVTVQLIDQNAPNADYINGMSRSILQGAYLQQKQWNRNHPDGPDIYLFIANVNPESLENQGQESTQQEVADQILHIQQRDQDHIIIGVVGLPFGTNTLTNKLNNAHIPMVSIAPLVSSNSQPSYLFSVAPSLDDEINEVVNLCRQYQKIQYYYDQNDSYSQTFTQLFQASSSNLPSTVDLLTYETIAPLARQVVDSNPDLVIFIGPDGDTANFLIQLRKAEKTNKSKSHTVLTGDNFYQWVYKYFTPDQRAAFDNIRFVAFAYPDSHQLPNNPYNMLDDFNNTFDPDREYSGNIYTHRRASSDAILAYDALSLLMNAQNNTTCTTSSCDAKAWGENLQYYIIRSKPFKGVSGQISFISGESAPHNKCLFSLVIQDQMNGNPQDFSGCY